MKFSGTIESISRCRNCDLRGNFTFQLIHREREIEKWVSKNSGHKRIEPFEVDFMPMAFFPVDHIRTYVRISVKQRIVIKYHPYICFECRVSVQCDAMRCAGLECILSGFCMRVPCCECFIDDLPFAFSVLS